MEATVAILGAGPAGLAAGYALRRAGVPCVLYEQADRAAGLCRSFAVQGFTFDTFIHFSSTRDAAVRALFDAAGPHLTHPAESQNYWRGYWLRHPAQNNLYTLPTEEKLRVIEGFIAREKLREPENYEQWLRLQYGDYFAENFPMEYTKKYWRRDARELGTGWIGVRLSQPGLDDMLRGALGENARNDYYISEMRYPETGGFEAFLAPLREGLDIRLNKRVVGVDPAKREIAFADGSGAGYGALISTIPLPVLIRCLPAPQGVRRAAGRLSWTQAAAVSIGVKGGDIFPFERPGSALPPALWFYVYDRDIPFARCYYPGRKSPNNVPEGMGAIQAECQFLNSETPPPAEELGARAVASLARMGVLKESDVLFADVRVAPYANVIFDHSIGEARGETRAYAESLGIRLAGRFGAWDYLWSDQSILSGWSAAEGLIG